MNDNTSLEGHTEDNAGTEEQLLVARRTLVQHQGPLPHPAILKQYDDVVAGAAERIITMAEQQAQHRQEIELRVIRTDNLKSLLGTIFAFVIALAGFGGGLYAALAGQPFWGGAVSIGTLTSVVIAFIYGTRYQRRELEK